MKRVKDNGFALLGVSALVLVLSIKLVLSSGHNFVFTLGAFMYHPVVIVFYVLMLLWFCWYVF